MFLSENFIFDGIWNEEKKLYICSLKKELFNEMGFEFKKDIKFEGGKNNFIYTDDNDIEGSQATFLLFYFDKKTKEPLEWTTEKIQDTYDWLITDYFAEFVSEDNLDISYYLKVTNIKKMLTFDKTGYLEVTVKNFSQYAYKNVQIIKEINERTVVKINNPSKEIYRPIIEITNLGDTNTINKINNLEIYSLEKNQTLSIDNATFQVQDTCGKNLFNNCNRQWVKLNCGENEIVLDGKMKIKIINRFPIAL